MFTQAGSEQLRRTSIKLNTIQMQSKDYGKKRIFSLRKLPKPNPIFNFGSNTNIKMQSVSPDKKIQQQQQLQQQKSPKKSPKNNQVGRLTIYKHLSPIKQYQTKLKISAESWLVYDYRKDSYKRGWRPAEIGQFNGMTRLLILKTYIQLEKWNPQLNFFNMRVNTNYLKQQVQLRREQRLPPRKKKGLILKQSISRILQNNIMINIVDVLFGLFMTNYDDILQYAIVFMGHLCSCFVNNTNPISQDSPCHAVQKITEAMANAQYFSQYLSSTLFPLLQMNSSKFHADTYTFQTCANDVCRLYLSIQDTPIFKQIINRMELTCKVKYQIGFRYWQLRTLTFKNRRIDLGRDYQFVAVWKSKKNYSVIARNLDLNFLIILEDCKFGMAQCDIQKIQNWVKDLMIPIIDKRKTHSKLLPLLRINNNSPLKSTHLLTQIKEQKQKTK